MRIRTSFFSYASLLPIDDHDVEYRLLTMSDHISTDQDFIVIDDKDDDHFTALEHERESLTIIEGNS